MSSWYKKAKHAFPINPNERQEGLWDQWLQNSITDEQFIDAIKDLEMLGFLGVSKDPTVRNGISKALQEFEQDGDPVKAAKKISSFLSVGKDVTEEFFGFSPAYAKTK